MSSHRVLRRAATVGCVGLMLLSGCRADDVADPDEGITALPDRPLKIVPDREAELLGNVYDGSAKTTDSTLYVHLVPLDSATIARLAGTNFDSTLWVNPDDPEFHFGYFAPPAGVDCGNDYATFLARDTSAFGREMHPPGPGQSAPDEAEAHCIIPGSYDIRLVTGAEADSVVESFRIDYVSGARLGGALVTVVTPDSLELDLEDPNWTPSNNAGWTDIVVNFHRNPGTFTDSARLEIENTGSNLFKSTFNPATNPVGSSSDWFRFRTDQTTSTWNLDSRGKSLVRIYYDGNNSTRRSGFMDPEFEEQRMLRVRRFDWVTTTPDTIQVGLEATRPDEAAATTASFIDTVRITSAPDPKPMACFRLEPGGAHTWKATDQFLDASCSVGEDLEFSWDTGTGSGFGAFGSDTIIEFFGHATDGNKTIRVRVRDLDFSPATQDTFAENIDVVNDQLTLSGPAYVFNKKLKTYTSTDTANWYERYDPDTLTQWYFTLDTAAVYNRIWPAGDYTRRLRAQDTTAAAIGRDFLDVVVCSIPGCTVEFVAGAELSEAAGGAEDQPWPLFGGGPWIIASDAIVRFYDLTGLHEPNSPFATLDWFVPGASGTTFDASGRWTAGWSVADEEKSNVRTVRFDVAGGSGEWFDFALALDPDLGKSAGDDRVRDEGDGLLVVFDSEEALGVMLRSSTGDDIQGLQQYGVERPAPRSRVDVKAATERQGLELTYGGGDDVQLLIRGGSASGIGSWTLVMIRGATVQEVKDTAAAIQE